MKSTTTDTTTRDSFNVITTEMTAAISCHDDDDDDDEILLRHNHRQELYNYIPPSHILMCVGCKHNFHHSVNVPIQSRTCGHSVCSGCLDATARKRFLDQQERQCLKHNDSDSSDDEEEGFFVPCLECHAPNAYYVPQLLSQSPQSKQSPQEPHNNNYSHVNWLAVTAISILNAREEYWNAIWDDQQQVIQQLQYKIQQQQHSHQHGRVRTTPRRSQTTSTTSSENQHRLVWVKQSDGNSNKTHDYRLAHLIGPVSNGVNASIQWNDTKEYTVVPMHQLSLLSDVKQPPTSQAANSTDSSDCNHHSPWVRRSERKVFKIGCRGNYWGESTTCSNTATSSCNKQQKQQKQRGRRKKHPSDKDIEKFKISRPIHMVDFSNKRDIADEDDIDSDSSESEDSTTTSSSYYEKEPDEDDYTEISHVVFSTANIEGTTTTTTNPVRKPGRPRGRKPKNLAAQSTPTTTSNNKRRGRPPKRAGQSASTAPTSTVAPKRRGRPPKINKPNGETAAAAAATTTTSNSNTPNRSPSSSPAPKRYRKVAPASSPAQQQKVVTVTFPPLTIKRGPGRPRKEDRGLSPLGSPSTAWKNAAATTSPVSKCAIGNATATTTFSKQHIGTTDVLTAKHTAYSATTASTPHKHGPGPPRRAQEQPTTHGMANRHRHKHHQQQHSSSKHDCDVVSSPKPSSSTSKPKSPSSSGGGQAFVKKMLGLPGRPAFPVASPVNKS